MKHFVRTVSGKAWPARPGALGCSRPSCARTISSSTRDHVVASSSVADLPPLLEINDEFDARHTFSDYANWLVPGYIMVGEYPFINGSTCKDYPEGEARLTQVLKAGITAFAATLRELPPQQDMPIGGVQSFIPYKPTADLIAASLSGPPPGEVVEGLRNPYLDKFIPPRRREASEEYKAYKPLMPHYYHMDLTSVMTKNDPAALDAFLGELEAELQQGGRVYIHCTGGTGRAGVVAALLLCKVYKLAPEEALERVQKTRNLRGDREEDGSFILSPHDEQQAEFVVEFSKRYT